MLISDASAYEILDKHMRGRLVLKEGETDDSVFQSFFDTKYHYSYSTDGVNSILCISDYGAYAVINFMWVAQSERRPMLKILLQLNEEFEGTPIYYQGINNVLSNHSAEVTKGIYQLMI